jgi:hypothetical protein
MAVQTIEVVVQEIAMTYPSTPELLNAESGCRATVQCKHNELTPPTTPPQRRGRSRSQKEADQERQLHAARLQRQRSATTGSLSAIKAPVRQISYEHRQSSSLSTNGPLSAVEPPHEHALTKMAYAEQQKWITVQQKTFTKWYVFCAGTCMAELAD